MLFDYCLCVRNLYDCLILISNQHYEFKILGESNEGLCGKRWLRIRVGRR